MFYNRLSRWRRCFLAFGVSTLSAKGERKTIPVQSDSSLTVTRGRS
jgi:hypothetical protein